MEYTISKTEIKRRKLAYLSLSISLVIGIFISAIIYQFPIPTLIYCLVSIFLLLLGAFSNYFFRKIAILKISFSGNALERKLADEIEDYPLAKIKKIKIKWTTHNSIREIYIWMNDGNSLFLTGIRNFEKFREDLLNRLSKQTTIQEWREPINFDSLLFYPILALLISNFSVLAFKNLIQIDYKQIKLAVWLFSVYLLVFALYFIFKTPIAKRSGNKTKLQDYILGILMLISGIFIFFMF